MSTEDKLVETIDRVLEEVGASRLNLRTDPYEDAIGIYAQAIARALIEAGMVAKRDQLEVIDERDAAEEALSQAYFLITGRPPEWSNLFGHAEALEEIDEAQAALRHEIKRLKAATEPADRPKAIAETPKAWTEEEATLLADARELVKINDDLVFQIDKFLPLDDPEVLDTPAADLLLSAGLRLAGSAALIERLAKALANPKGEADGR